MGTAFTQEPCHRNGWRKTRCAVPVQPFGTGTLRARRPPDSTASSPTTSAASGRYACGAGCRRASAIRPAALREAWVAVDFELVAQVLTGLQRRHAERPSTAARSCQRVDGLRPASRCCAPAVLPVQSPLAAVEQVAATSPPPSARRRSPQSEVSRPSSKCRGLCALHAHRALDSAGLAGPSLCRYGAATSA